MSRAASVGSLACAGTSGRDGEADQRNDRPVVGVRSAEGQELTEPLSRHPVAQGEGDAQKDEDLAPVRHEWPESDDDGGDGQQYRHPNAGTREGMAERVQEMGVPARFPGRSCGHLISHRIAGAVGGEHPDDGFEDPDGGPDQQGTGSAQRRPRPATEESAPTLARFGSPSSPRPHHDAEQDVEADRTRRTGEG